MLSIAASRFNATFGLFNQPGFVTGLERKEEARESWFPFYKKVNNSQRALVLGANPLKASEWFFLEIIPGY